MTFMWDLVYVALKIPYSEKSQAKCSTFSDSRENLHFVSDGNVIHFTSMCELGTAEEVRPKGGFGSDHVALCHLCVPSGKNFHSHKISLWPNSYKLSSLFLKKQKTKIITFEDKVCPNLDCVWSSHGHFISALQISSKNVLRKKPTAQIDQVRKLPRKAVFLKLGVFQNWQLSSGRRFSTESL